MDEIDCGNDPDQRIPTVATLAALAAIVARVINEDEEASPVERLTYSIRERFSRQIGLFCQSSIKNNPKIQLGLRKTWEHILGEADEPTM